MVPAAEGSADVVSTRIRIKAMTSRQALAFITEGDLPEVKVRIRSRTRATCSVHGTGPHDLCLHTHALSEHHRHERNHR